MYYYLIISVVTFLTWGYDKIQARSNRWRVSEKTLFLLTLAGGALGALAGMLVFRHKIHKPAFWVVAIASFAIHAFFWIK